MIRPSFLSGKGRSRLLSPWIWLFFHGGIFAALGLSLIFLGNVRINTNLFDILPASRSLKAVAVADKALGDRNSRQTTILAGHPDFAQAKQGAELLYQSLLAGEPAGEKFLFEDLSLFVDETVIAQLTEYLFRYRYTLLDEATRDSLENGGAETIAQDALAAIFSAFSFSSLDYLEEDPFFLTDRGMRSFLNRALQSGGAMSLRDDVLAVQYEGRWYVLLRATLTKAGAAITNKTSAVERIYHAGETIGKEIPALQFVYSGAPFHSYESSSNAQREISRISTITLIIIIFLFLYIFRSPLPVLVSVSATFLSIGLALAASFLFFREVHVLTLVFGTTLIGTCVDYSVHYFIRWKGDRNLKTGAEIRASIIKGVFLSFVSTEICFLALLFAPFIILKQFAVFSLTGLLSAFLSVGCIYPLWNIPPANRRVIQFSPWYRKTPLIAPLPEPGSAPVLFERPLKIAVLGCIFLGALTILVINRDKVRVENNIGGLYTMSKTLMESERMSSQALNHGSVGWYFIVSGADSQETLENEERLRMRLDTEIAAGNAGSYLAVSQFVPSVAAQKRNYRAARNLLPLAESQYAYLGFPPEEAAVFRENFEAAEETYAFPGESLPPYLQGITANLWIGEKEGGTYSCVLPLHVKEDAPFRAMAEELDNVYFVNKVQDIGRELNTLTRIMLLLFLGAYMVIAITVKLVYPWDKTFRICLVPFLLALVTVTVLASLNIPLGFFSVVGLILVFGLGLDYMFYITESEKVNQDGREAGEPFLTNLAIFLSFATTALSFGALALSTFVPVHLFGLTVFTGLTTAFVCAMLVSGKDQRNTHNKI
ncbi:MAG: MMPL family transporter [Treponema sp.]|jgi:predicted exporter|nr:MMPL family transporter [Treponema sp.]